MGKTIGIIQARMASRRLPGKILAPLADRPVLEQLAARISASRIDEWWLATTDEPSDDVTEAWGFELGLRVFRGHASDVLSRFVAIGREASAEWLIRVVASNPFLDAPLIDRLLDARDANPEAKRSDLLQYRRDLATLGSAAVSHGLATPSPGMPVGYGAELIRHEALERSALEIPRRGAHHRVHVTSWLMTMGRSFDVAIPTAWPDRRNWRWTLDTYQDLAMARSAFRLFGSDASHIDYPEMVARLDAHPEITAMNAQVANAPLEEG